MLAGVVTLTLSDWTPGRQAYDQVRTLSLILLTLLLLLEVRSIMMVM